MGTSQDSMYLQNLYGDYFFTVVGVVGNPLVSLQSKARIEGDIQKELDELQRKVQSAEAALLAVRRNKHTTPNDPDIPVAFFDADDLDDDPEERAWNGRNWE